MNSIRKCIPCKKKTLLHICCAPCSIYPLKALRSDDYNITGYFYNPNIHPYQEYMRREDTLQDYAALEKLEVTYHDGYEIEYFLRSVVFHEKDRCRYCYHDRLTATAIMARRGQFDFFTSTLLYSKFQNHDLIRSIGESLGKAYGVDFLYRDFRKGWNEGVEISKKMGMYRQQYCGCIYSEKDRFFRKSRT